jgi:uncharacterized protein (TIGR00369 family)
MKQLPHTRSCFVCGEANPAGLNLRFETDGRVVTTRFVPRIEHAGFKKTIHGGILATLLDEIMVWACAVRTQRFAFCAELNVRYLKSVRPEEEVVAIGELVNNRRNKLFEAKAELQNLDGEILTTASGKYMPIQQSLLSGLAEDFIGEPVFSVQTS